MPEIVVSKTMGAATVVVRVSRVEFGMLSPERRDALLKSSLPSAHIAVDQMAWGDIYVEQLFHAQPPHPVRKHLETCLLKFVEHVIGKEEETRQ